MVAALDPQPIAGIPSASGYPVEWSTSETHYFLRADPTIRCNRSNAHDTIVTEAIVLVFVWPVGSFCLFLGLVLGRRRHLLSHTCDRYTLAIKVLHKDFKDDCCASAAARYNVDIACTH